MSRPPRAFRSPCVSSTSADHPHPQRENTMAFGMPTLGPRFWLRVSMPSPDACWEWSGTRNEHGYGVIRVGRRNWRTHRVMWAIVNGEDVLPPEMKLLHRCDNPPCCNPAHLRTGTQADNVADMHSKGRRTYYRKHGPRPAPRKGGRFKNATHCLHGHEFTPENTILVPDAREATGTFRACRICRKRNSTLAAAKRKAARAARKREV